MKSDCIASQLKKALSEANTTSKTSSQSKTDLQEQQHASYFLAKWAYKISHNRQMSRFEHYRSDVNDLMSAEQNRKFSSGPDTVVSSKLNNNVLLILSLTTVTARTMMLSLWLLVDQETTRIDGIVSRTKSERNKSRCFPPGIVVQIQTHLWLENRWCMIER